ncbi:hypothetical protein [Pseudoalteromonas luteoviolacea]|uniref:hypothetical protein n=1 Tax=Pseudoalteromonas luteoviolacea TaxID=43657 RepID=UPI00114DFE30|nr:hypothetical protein [Pseudoalteromonas luteoviolacea]TQF67878.1 hypothetical protein FLM44_22115 [Pseudoalteromonas luteoviolacea]
MANYAIFAADADINYYEGAPEVFFCSSCGSYTNSRQYFPNDLKVKSLKNDFSYSYDGQLIISTKAKVFLEENSSTKLEFHRVNSNPEAFVIEAPDKAVFDSEKRKTRLSGECSKCGKFESIVGSTPPFLKNVNEIEQMGMYFTDIKFGSGKEKSPLIIVGEALGKLLKKTFKEIDLEEVRG